MELLTVFFKKGIAFSAIALLTFSTLTGCQSGSSKSIKSIGISQIVEHPALDSAREGFLEGLKSEGLVENVDFKISYENAQGDMSLATSIGHKFASEKKDLIFAISTPSAQGALNSTKDIPIVLTAVTDPVDAGLVKSLKSSGNNVTGTIDAPPLEEQLKLMRNIFPEKKIIGTIYNPSEKNSEIQISNLESLAPKYGFKINKIGINSVNDISLAVNSLLDKSEIIYTPLDNTVASSLPIIVNAANSKKIPIFGSEEAHVKAGATITLGIDYFELGKKSGKMASLILSGKKSPSEIPIEGLDSYSIVWNSTSADLIGTTLPKNLNLDVKVVK